MEAREERQPRQLPEGVGRQLFLAQVGQCLESDHQYHARRRLIRVQDRYGSQDVGQQVHARSRVRGGALRRLEGQGEAN